MVPFAVLSILLQCLFLKFDPPKDLVAQEKFDEALNAIKGLYKIRYD
jgi:hypothetical protein